MRTLLLIGIFLTFGILNAQTDFKPGYIIKNSGDTIYGQIDDRKAKSMSQLCRFKNSENSIREYLPKDIKAYRFINDKYYVSKEIESQSYFLEYLINGKLNVYYSKHDNFGHYYVDNENNPLVELPYEESTQYIDSKRIAFKSNKHIGILNYYTQDAPQLKSKILAIKKPNHNELINLAEEYHNALSDEFDSLIYKKNKLKVRLSPEFSV